MRLSLFNAGEHRSRPVIALYLPDSNRPNRHSLAEVPVWPTNTPAGGKNPSGAGRRGACLPR
ncbi:hypothetical protein GCE86_16080 [Micromonospora terminaliae]|uniref:Uncharacterized protein n=1 Tax=Micromonospora terminaliae TaxID=1914461 RepID=A0ABX6E601_9ACTN|nr:hypothetical protein GCE86_16080 [Micromonospora terminaliae]